VLVGIERTSPNSRRISGEIMLDTPIDAIWNILTDYDNLSIHVPNLVESKVINNGGRSVGGRPRVYQRGAQRIFGFEFGADVTMDMTEYVHHVGLENESDLYSIEFECVDSQFFSQFDGSWILEDCNGKTMVRYIVDVRPKGPVPVAALEWRIKEDVPVNILAVSKAAVANYLGRTNQERSDIAGNEDYQRRDQTQPPSTRRQALDRRKQWMNPLQQLTDQAANNLKRTAKSVLPPPVLSTAKYAIKAATDPNSSVGPRRRTSLVSSMASDIESSGYASGQVGAKKIAGLAKENKLSRRASSVDWYDDETMGWYLKYSLLYFMNVEHSNCT
jgi:hypothetical protein